jgi:hypothetical protein
MPDPSGTPTLPPGTLQVDSEILASLLGQVVQAASRSAEGAIASASAIQEFKVALESNTKEVQRLADLKEKEVKQEEARLHWKVALIRPETLYYTILIAAAVLGIKLIPVTLPSLP